MMRFPPANIAPTDIPGELLPLLNPNYWDGEILGDDSGMGAPQPTSNASHDRAVKALAGSVRQGSLDGSLRAFETGQAYREGKTFVADLHTIGSVVILRKEQLSRERTIGEYADMSELDGTEPPEPPTDLEVDFSVRSLARGEADYITGAGIVYRSAVHLGIVAQDHEGQNRLFTVPHDHANRGFLNPGVIEVGTQFGSTMEPDPIRVGEVQHYSGRWSKDERIERVTSLVTSTMPEVMTRRRALQRVS